MFKLLKLILVGLISYTAYDFIRGLMDDGDDGSDRRQSGPSSPQLGRALEIDAGRTNMTGPARGERVQTEDFTGESVPHFVGRGVVRR
jgi:hypothetical protein